MYQAFFRDTGVCVAQIFSLGLPEVPLRVSAAAPPSTKRSLESDGMSRAVRGANEKTMRRKQCCIWALREWANLGLSNAEAKSCGAKPLTNCMEPLSLCVTHGPLCLIFQR